MSRIIITTAVGGFHKGECIEASAALVTALGSNARAVTLTANALSPTRDQAGEAFAASNASA
jgi:hypothetical protein